MTNSCHAGKGVLVLSRVTPIIIALFDEFSFDPSFPLHGMACIAIRDVESSPNWNRIARNLTELAHRQAINLDACADMKEIIRAFAFRYPPENNGVMECLLEEHAFREDEKADLETLFQIALVLDDGHNLTDLCFEGRWRCKQPCLFGTGEEHFYSKEMSLKNSLFSIHLRKTLSADRAPRIS